MWRGSFSSHIYGTLEIPALGTDYELGKVGILNNRGAKDLIAQRWTNLVRVAFP